MTQSPGPHDAAPHDDGPRDAAQDAENVQAAMELRRQRPTWVIVWSAPLRRFSAGPLFRAPRGPDLTAPTIGELAALMDQVEQAARRASTIAAEATEPQRAGEH
jgi:hypothetical protein